MVSLVCQSIVISKNWGRQILQGWGGLRISEESKNASPKGVKIYDFL